MSAREGRAVFESLESRTMLAAGDLDPSFGNGGKLTTAFAGWGSITPVDVAVRPDGSFLVGGTIANSQRELGDDLFVARFLANGSLDTRFGTGGLVTRSFVTEDEARGMVVQADGKVILSFRDMGWRLNLVRFTATGQPDSSFGNAGRVVTPLEASGLQRGEKDGMAIQPSGQILVAGVLRNGNGTRAMAVCRVSSAGVLDTSFGNGGTAAIPFPPLAGGGAREIALRTDGSMVVEGEPDLDFLDVGVASLSANGALDASFGSSGLVSYDFGASVAAAAGIGLDGAGRILVGAIVGPGNYHYRVARFRPNGGLDTSFGSGGQVATQLGGLGPGVPSDLLVDAAGGVYVGSRVGADFGLAHVTSAGQADTAFGVNGLVTTDINGQMDGIVALAFAGSSRLLAIGTSGAITGPTGLAIAQYVLGSQAIKPATPATFAAAPGAGKIVLTWTASSGASSYRLYRSTTPGGEGSTPYKTGLTGTSFTDTAVIPGQPYSYQITAVSSVGESSKSAERSAIASGVQSIPAQAFANGRANDMAYDNTGRLHLVYFDASSQTLKYASRSFGGTWSAVSTVDSAAGAGQYLSLGVNASNLLAAAYYDAANADLKYAQYNGSSWDKITVDSSRKVGLYPSLAFDSAGHAVISYYNKTYGDLKLAAWSGVSWSISTVDGNADSGRYSSLAANPATGRWAIAYENDSDGTFRLAEQSKAGWGFTVVDDTQGGGGYTSLAFNSTGGAGISYYDAWNTNLKFATRSPGSARWAMGTVASAGSQGMYGQLHYASGSSTADILFYNKTADAVMSCSGYQPGAWSTTAIVSGGGRELSAAWSSGGKRTVGWFDTASVGLMVQDM